jgi:hypothetical protein
MRVIVRRPTLTTKLTAMISTDVNANLGATDDSCKEGLAYTDFWSAVFKIP